MTFMCGARASANSNATTTHVLITGQLEFHIHGDSAELLLAPLIGDEDGTDPQFTPTCRR